MNVVSLQHNNKKNQHQSAWKDDPFNLKGLVTGVTPLSHKDNLTAYAQEMVASFATFKDDQYDLTLDMLSTPYQLEFARLYIESIDREIEWACYGDDQTLNSDFLCAMLSMLKDSTPKTRANFAQVTTVNILTYYKDTLQDLLDEACEIVYRNEMDESNCALHQDGEHDELRWSAF